MKTAERITYALMTMKRNEEILYLESDPKIFEDRFARCRRLLHFLAARILGSQDEAEDAVRNCRAAASRNPPSFESEGAFRSWLARILLDEACALLRRKQFPHGREDGPQANRSVIGASTGD